MFPRCLAYAVRPQTTLVSVLAFQIITTAQLAGGAIDAADYESIQAAIDANPGRVISLTAPRYEIDQPIRITIDGSGLQGHAEIIQSNPRRQAILIERANNIIVRDVTLNRPVTGERNYACALRVIEGRNVRIDSCRILNNKSQDAAVRFEHSRDCSVTNCEIINYKCIGVDDRTHNSLQGYAFHCIDGTGLTVARCQNILVQSNQIVEHDYLPTKENQQKYNLGDLTEGRHPTKLGDLGKRAAGSGHMPHWHQGSAIVVSSPNETRLIRIVDNYIENAAQGVDMHCDQTICSDNIVNKAQIGLKATHGARNLILADNLLKGCDLWGIVMNPGAGSHHANAEKEGVAAKPANVDGGTIISGNLITEFGYGNDYWRYGGRQDDRGSSYGIALMDAQLDSNPPLRDILVQGNMVYDNETELEGEDRDRPRYRYAIFVATQNPKPRNLRFSGNLFSPGTEGISNIELTPRMLAAP